MLGARIVVTLSLLIISSSGLDAGPTPPVARGAIYYLSPAGDDSNPGTTPGRPWRTFDKVLNASRPLRAGDTVVLLDGTSPRQTTALPHPASRPNATAPTRTPD